MHMLEFELQDADLIQKTLTKWQFRHHEKGRPS